MHRQRNAAWSRQYIIDIALTAAQLQAFYAGSVGQVSARDRRGVRLQFPLASLRPYVDHQGVRGTFRLIVDAENRLLNLERLT